MHSAPITFNSPKFSGIGSLLGQASTGQRLLALGANKLEGANSGYAHTKFIQDVTAVWGTRMVASRSTAENTEITFLELLENVLVYYGIGFLGSTVFQKAFSKLASKNIEQAGEKLSQETLKLSLKEIAKKSPALAQKVLPIRLATIIAAFSVAAISGEYALLFVKNLLTAKAFNKESFSDVVDLSNNGIKDLEQSETVQKAHKRIAQCLAISGGLVLLASSIARFGGGSKLIGKLQKVTEKFDFNFKDGKMSLGRNQFIAFLGISAAAYLDSSRDNLERKEVATRLAIVMPYMAFGEEMLKASLVKLFGQKFPELLKTDENGKKVVKTLEELGNNALEKAKTTLKTKLPAGKITEKALQDEASKILKPLLRGKNSLFYIPHAIGILGVGLGTALLNRYWTEVRFNKAKQEKTKQSSQQFGQGLDHQRKNQENFDRFVVRVRQTRNFRADQPSPYRQQAGYRLTVSV